MKILLAGGGTGGHLMPALSIADALTRLREDVQPVLVGAQRGVESSLLPHRVPAYPFFLLPAEPIYRAQWWKNIRWIPLLNRLRRECRTILDDVRPAVAVGTGGYASGPILYFAHRRGIPLALQEQNASPGLTTRLLARRASQLHLGFAEAAAALRTSRNTEVCAFGNPIAPPPANADDRVVGRAELGIPDGPPVCFVMGGSQGARGINEAVGAALDSGVLDDVVLLWSTGNAMWNRFRRHHQPPMREVRPFWDPVAAAYRAADVVVARAGAMTTAELAAWGLPSILIPLPTAAADHQTKNALALEAAGTAIHLAESNLGAGGATLIEVLRALLGDEERRSRMATAARGRGHPDAADRIAERILTLAGRQSLS